MIGNEFESMGDRLEQGRFEAESLLRLFQTHLLPVVAIDQQIDRLLGSRAGQRENIAEVDSESMLVVC